MAPISGILQARILEWVAISFFTMLKIKTVSTSDMATSNMDIRQICLRITNLFKIIEPNLCFRDTIEKKTSQNCPLVHSILHMK